MPRSAGNLELSQFTKGILTEANPLNFPQDGALVDENLILNLNGSRQRRLGLAYESDAVLTDLGVTAAVASTYAYSVHEWVNVNDDSSLGLLVVQVEDKLYFYDLYASPVSGRLSYNQQ
jgi:hypothetical protein